MNPNESDSFKFIALYCYAKSLLISFSWGMRLFLYQFGSCSCCRLMPVFVLAGQGITRRVLMLAKCHLEIYDQCLKIFLSVCYSPGMLFFYYQFGSCSCCRLMPVFVLAGQGITQRVLMLAECCSEFNRSSSSSSHHP